jgi:hypothetical protein
MSITGKYNSLVLSLCLTGMLGQPQTPSRSQQPPAIDQTNRHYLQYRELVERVKKGDPSVDFVQLISAASDWELSEKSLIEAPNRDEMVQAFKKKDYKRAVKLADLVLNYEFTNRSLHLATADAYENLADNANANFHRETAERILKALLSTGDGKTVDTAYCVQSINEEYVIMRYFGFKVSMQAYIISGNSSYDLLSGKDEKTGKDVGLYFDISGYFSRCVQSHKQKTN